MKNYLHQNCKHNVTEIALKLDPRLNLFVSVSMIFNDYIHQQSPNITIPRFGLFAKEMD